jgi:hypothetical protein
MADRRDAYRDLMGRLEGRSLLGTPRSKWKDDIKIFIQEVEWGGMEWIDRAQDKDRWQAVENAATNLRVP